MRRVVTWMGIGLGVLLLLAVIVLIAAPYVVNLERYRSLLASRASRALGRDVTLGALKVSLWSGVGAEAQGIRVAAAPGFGPEPFVAADALRVRVHLLPLLRGQLKVSTATLERPRIRLVHAADGRWSFEDLLRPAPAAPAPRHAPEPSRAPKSPLLGGVLLSEVDVKNGELALLDQAGKQRFTTTLTDVDLALRQRALSDPVQVRGRGTVGDDGGRIELTGKLTPESDTLSLDLAVTLREIAATVLQALVLGSDSAVQLSGRLSGEARITGVPAKAAVAGQLDLKSLAVRVAGLGKPAGDEGRLSFTVQRADPGLRVSQLELRLQDLSLDATGQIPDLKAPQIVFDASAPRLDVDRLLGSEPARTSWLGATPAYAAAPQPPAAAPAIPIQGRVQVAELRYSGLALTGLDGHIRYRGGLLSIPGAQAGLARGRIAVSGEMDFRGAQPRVSLRTRLTDVATEPVVKALAAGPWSLQSRLNGTTDLSFSGLSKSAVLASASGTGSLQLADGRILNYQPLERLAEVIAPVLASQGVRTRLNEFQQLTGTFSVDKGVLRTRDLTLTKAEGTVVAAGSLGLLDSTVDLDVTARLGRTTVEAKVTGTTSRPTVVPKLGRLQQKLERELDKVLHGEQGKGLKELFRNFFQPK